MLDYAGVIFGVQFDTLWPKRRVDRCKVAATGHRSTEPANFMQNAANFTDTVAIAVVI